MPDPLVHLQTIFPAFDFAAAGGYLLLIDLMAFCALTMCWQTSEAPVKYRRRPPTR